eukprot:8293406-Karenia_brevis.AAC.1
MPCRTTASISEAMHHTYSLIFTSAQTDSAVLCCTGTSGGFNVNGVINSVGKTMSLGRWKSGAEHLLLYIRLALTHRNFVPFIRSGTGIAVRENQSCKQH